VVVAKKQLSKFIIWVIILIVKLKIDCSIFKFF